MCYKNLNVFCIPFAGDEEKKNSFLVMRLLGNVEMKRWLLKAG